MREVKMRSAIDLTIAAVVTQSADSFPLMHKFVRNLAPIKADMMKKGFSRQNDSLDPFVLQLVEHGHGAHAEYMINASDKPGSSKAIMELNKEFGDMAINGCYGVPTSTWGDRMHDVFGPTASNYHLWLRKVKKAFDPNGVSEANTYISIKE